MTLTADERALLARRARDRDAVSYEYVVRPIMLRITAADLEPYRADLERFTALPFGGAPHGNATWGDVQRELFHGTIESYDAGLPSFFAWLEDHQAAEAVPSGDTANVRDIAYWNWLVRTSHWAPHLDDLIRFIPESNFAFWQPDTIRCILGLPYGSTEAGMSGWLNDTEDATPGSARIHPYLGEFARAVVGGRFALSTPVTTEEPTTMTDPVLTPELLDQPVYQWPRATREAAQHEIARYFFENHIGISDTIEQCLENSNNALLFEDRGDVSYWNTVEFGPHRRFRNAVRDGSFVTPLTSAVPSGDTTPPADAVVTDPTVLEFARIYAGLPDIDPTGSVTHGYGDSGRMQVTESAQTAFLAMPLIFRERWRGLYREAEVALDRPNLAGVSAEEFVTNAYGYSTENFFRWARRYGVTAPHGIPVFPLAVLSGDTATPDEFPFDASYETIAANRYEIFTRYQTQWFAWCRQQNLGQWDVDNHDVPTENSFQRALTGEYLGDSYWNERDWAAEVQVFRAFVDHARAHRGEFTAAPTTTPEATITDTPAAVIPIGPDHPDWQAFAERLAEVATRAGMCPEYERIARLVGLPGRKERVTYRIVLDVPVTVERGEAADIRSLRDAAATALEAATASGTRRLESSRTQIVG